MKNLKDVKFLRVKEYFTFDGPLSNEDLLKISDKMVQLVGNWNKPTLFAFLKEALSGNTKQQQRIFIEENEAGSQVPHTVFVMTFRPAMIDGVVGEIETIYIFGATPAIGNRKPDEAARLTIPVIPAVSYSITNSKVELSDFFRLLPVTAKLYRPSGDLVFCHFDPSGKSYAPHPTEGEHWNYLEIHHSGDELLYMLTVIFRSNQDGPARSNTNDDR